MNADPFRVSPRSQFNDRLQPVSVKLCTTRQKFIQPAANNLQSLDERAGFSAHECGVRALPCAHKNALTFQATLTPETAHEFLLRNSETGHGLSVPTLDNCSGELFAPFCRLKNISEQALQVCPKLRTVSIPISHGAFRVPLKPPDQALAARVDLPSDPQRRGLPRHR